MEDDLPTLNVRLWRADAIVLFDRLMSTDLDSVPITHPSQKQALADLLSRLAAGNVGRLGIRRWSGQAKPAVRCSFTAKRPVCCRSVAKRYARGVLLSSGVTG